MSNHVFKNQADFGQCEFCDRKTKAKQGYKLSTILTDLAYKTCIHYCEFSDLCHIMVSIPLCVQSWHFFCCIWCSPPVIGRKIIPYILFLQFCRHSHIEMVKREKRVGRVLDSSTFQQTCLEDLLWARCCAAKINQT